MNEQVQHILDTTDSRIQALHELDIFIKTQAITVGHLSQAIVDAQVVARQLVIEEMSGATFDNDPPMPPVPPAYALNAGVQYSIKNGEAFDNNNVLLLPDSGLEPVARIQRHHSLQVQNGATAELVVVVNVHDDAGRVKLCYGNSAQDPALVAGQVYMHLIGVNPGARVGLGGIGDKFGFVGRFGLHNLDTYGINDDSFVQRQFGRVGTIIRDNCAFVNDHPKGPDAMWTSGMHFSHGMDQLIWTNERFIGARIREHLCYINDMTGCTGIWVLNNNMLGGNRSGLQVRPYKFTEGYDPKNPIEGPLVIDGNYCDRHGWNHDNADGGAVISVWSNPNHPTWITNNRFTNSRYGGIMLSDQSAERNWLNANGFPIGQVYMHGNTVVGSERADVSVAGVERLEWLNNKVDTLQINTQWSHLKGAGIDVGQVLADQLPVDTKTWVDGKNVQWTS